MSGAVAGTTDGQPLADDGSAALAAVVVLGEEEQGRVEEAEAKRSEVGWTSGEIDEETEDFGADDDDDERLFRCSGSLRGTENLQPICGMFEMEMCLAPESLGRPVDDVDEAEDGGEMTEQMADEVGVPGCDAV